MASERSSLHPDPLPPLESATVTVTVDSRARVSLADVGADASILIRREFTYENPLRKKAEGQILALERARKQGRQVNRQLFARLYAQMKGEPTTIETWHEDDGVISVPRGGTARLADVLEDQDFDVEFIDKRTEGLEGKPHYSLRVEPWPFQQQIVDSLLPREQGMLRAPTGAGKTIALLMLLLQAGVPALVVVWTASLLDQWMRQLQAKLGIREREIGVIGQGEHRVRPITVGMQQTIKNRLPELAPQFGFVGCDEVHKFAAATFRDVVDHLPARYRYGVSADERRKDGKTFLLADTFGEVEASINKASLVEAGIVLDVEVRVVETGFSCPAYERLPEEQRGSYFNELLDALTHDAQRNALIAELAVVETGRGEQVLVFSHRVDHCRRIAADVAREESRVGLLLGGQDNRAEFRENVDRLLDGRLRVGVGTYQAVGTGNDLPSVARGIACTPIHNNAPFLGQVMGRLCRTSEGTGKRDAVLYYLWDRQIHGLSPVRKLAHAAKCVRVKVGDTWVPAKDFLAVVKAGEL